VGVVARVTWGPDAAHTVRRQPSATPGSFVLRPRDVPHLLTVHSHTVRVLTLCTPSGLESLFVGLGRPAPDRTVPVGEPGPDAERVATLAGHYGAEVLTAWP
jgi:hypothetical protein